MCRAHGGQGGGGTPEPEGRSEGTCRDHLHHPSAPSRSSWIRWLKLALSPFPNACQSGGAQPPWHTHSFARWFCFFIRPGHFLCPGNFRRLGPLSVSSEQVGGESKDLSPEPSLLQEGQAPFSQPFLACPGFIIPQTNAGGFDGLVSVRRCCSWTREPHPGCSTPDVLSQGPEGQGHPPAPAGTTGTNTAPGEPDCCTGAGCAVFTWGSPKSPFLGICLPGSQPPARRPAQAASCTRCKPSACSFGPSCASCQPMALALNKSRV